MDHVTISRLAVARLAIEQAFPFHRECFRRGQYIYISPISGKRLIFVASIVLPTKTKHPFMQICIGLDDEAGSNKEILLFFGEEYGFPTALYEAGSMHILYGKDDWLEHEWIMSTNSCLLSNITLKVVRYSNSLLEQDLAGRHRHICVGATNSLGHNLLNDVSGLLELVKYSLLKGYNVSLVSLDCGFFDVIAASNIADLTGISYESLLQNGYANHSYLNLPFYVRAYGYGFLDKEFNILMAGNKSLENARPVNRTGKILYISIRSRHEDRHSEELYFKTLEIVLSELRIEKYKTIVFDGMTKTENDKSLRFGDMLPHIDSQLKVASEFRTSIESCFPELDYINLINSKMIDKIHFAMKSSVFVGPFGSGTWPTAFMRRGTAFVLFQGDSTGLKNDPSFDYLGNNINVTYNIVQVGARE